jgi:tetratricopeptide (TPR) repeat protein
MTSDADRRQRHSDAERRLHDAHLLLAAADPGDPDEPNVWPRYEELHADIGPSDVAECPDESARRLIINLVRYLNARGDLPSAAHLADSALERWTTENDVDADSCGHLELRRVQVGLLLSRGRYQDAELAGHETLSQMRRNPGRWQEEMIILSRIDGVLLRVQGNFAGALAASKRSFDEHAASKLGRDHPQTFAAANELITGYALASDLRAATDLAERTLRDCTVLWDRPGHPHPLVLCQRNALARCLRLRGNFAEAWASAREASEGYARLAAHGLLHEGHPRFLEHEIDYAAIVRDMGADDATLDGLAARLQQVYMRCWQAFDVDHPLTLAAAVTRASILRMLPDRAMDALRDVTDAELHYRRALPEHPYGYASQVLLASIKRQLGSPLRAVEELEPAAAKLRDTAGADHACTLVADVALMNALADAGELPAALARGRQAHAALAQALGARHPQTLSCGANLAAVSVLARERDAERAAEEALTQLRAALGAAHPAVRMLSSGQRFDLDFTPLPL